MTYHSTTPFGQRSVTAGLLKNAQAARQPAPVSRIDKWELFRQVCTARSAFGLTDRDLTVLNALLSFHPLRALDAEEQTTVFPSNRALSERTHGMAESTLRRHLAALVRSGLVLRQDSPNGKRYVRRNRNGEIVRAFGFDLRPLLCRAVEIASAAQDAEHAAELLKELRETMILKKRDAIKLAEFGRAEGRAENWDEIFDMLALLQRKSRRRLDMVSLQSLHDDVENLLNRVVIATADTQILDGNEVQNERHLQNSDTNTFDSEHTLEKKQSVAEPPEQNCAAPEIRIPLSAVVKACPDLQPYSREPIHHWGVLYKTADLVRGMMGISQSAWDEAILAMGPECTATVVAGILQRIDEIKNPGGYLRSLSRKAQIGKFSPAPMIMSLLSRTELAKS